MSALRDLTTTDLSLAAACSALTALRLRRPCADPCAAPSFWPKDFKLWWPVADLQRLPRHLPHLRLLSGLSVCTHLQRNGSWCVESSCAQWVADTVRAFTSLRTLELTRWYAALCGRCAVSAAVVLLLSSVCGLRS
jgi:hypothetical protein